MGFLRKRGGGRTTWNSCRGLKPGRSSGSLAIHKRRVGHLKPLDDAGVFSIDPNFILTLPVAVCPPLRVGVILPMSVCPPADECLHPAGELGKLRVGHLKFSEQRVGHLNSENACGSPEILRAACGSLELGKRVWIT